MAAIDVAADRTSLWLHVKQFVMSNNRVHVTCGVHSTVDSLQQSTELRPLQTAAVDHVGVGDTCGGRIRLHIHMHTT